MRYRTLRHGASAAALATGLAAAPLAAEVPRVMTDIAVTHSLVATVMGDLGAPDLLLERGADPHHFQLRPTQARALSQAGLVVWLGPEMTPWLVRGLENLAHGEALDLLDIEGLRLQPYQPTRLTGAAAEAAREHAHDHSHGHGHGHDDHGHGHDDDHDHDHGHGHDHGHDDDHHHDHDDHGHGDDDHGHGHGHDDHGHDDNGHSHGHEHDHDHGHDDHAHDDHDHGHGHDDDSHGHDHGHGHDDHGHDDHGHDHHHGDKDVHAWMDPANAMLWLDAIADQLAGMDPENAETYRANAAAGRESIDAMAQDIAAILAPVQGRGFVVYHDAYGYLATAFGLNILGSITLGDAADPGAARLSAIRASLVDAGAVCIFPEVNHPDAYVALMTDAATGLRVGQALDPAGVMLEPGPGTYEQLMRDMAQGIADCLSEG